MKCRLYASLQINEDFDLSETTKKLSETADKLSNLFGGIVFEDSDRFDEVPTFVAILDQIELILMGPPDDVYEMYNIDKADYFCFSMRCNASIDLVLYQKYNSRLLNFLLTEDLKVEKGSHIDVTLNLIDFINKNSTLKCELLT